MKNFNFAINFVISFDALGGIMDQYVTPKIFERTGSISDCFLLGFYLCVMSLVSVIIVALFETYAQKRDKLTQTVIQDQNEKVHFSDIYKFNKLY